MEQEVDGVIIGEEIIVEVAGAVRAGPASFTVGKGSITVLAGPNGAGKTTLLKAIAGLAGRVKGRLTVKGSPTYIPQSDLLLPWKTLLENIMLPLLVKGVPRREAAAKASRVATLLGLTEHLDKYPRHASGGTRRKAAVARGLVAGADILLLDEPYTGLDVAAAAALTEVLAELSLGGLTIILVTHDIYLASRIADQILVLLPPPRGLSGAYALEGLDAGERYRVAETVVSLISSQGSGPRASPGSPS